MYRLQGHHFSQNKFSIYFLRLIAAPQYHFWDEGPPKSAVWTDLAPKVPIYTQNYPATAPKNPPGVKIIFGPTSAIF